MNKPWIRKTMLLFSVICLLGALPAAGISQTTPTDGDWSQKTVVLRDTPEARLMVRTGDIDNLGFGWPEGFDPFSGNSTPRHDYPWTADPEDPEGTDRIMVVTSYDYNGSDPCGRDGYTSRTSRPDNNVQTITLKFNPKGIQIRSAILQVFVDDFQAPELCASYQVELDGVRAAFLEDIINKLVQTGPIGKLMSVAIPIGYLNLLQDGILTIRIDDMTTGAGDGYAIDFAKLLINPKNFSQTGTIQGKVVDSSNQLPIKSAIVSAGGIVQAKTNEEGRYILTNVPAGLVTLEAFKPGYETGQQTIDLIAGETITQDFALNATRKAADLSVTKTASPDPVKMGENLTYTIKVSNNGPNDATDVVLIDSLPESVVFVSATPDQGSCTELDRTVTCNLGAIANEATVSTSIVVTTTAPGELENSAQVKAREKDLKPRNNQAVAKSIVVPESVTDLTGEWESLTQKCKGGLCYLEGVFLVKNMGTTDATPFLLTFLSSGLSNSKLKQLRIKSLAAGETLSVPLTVNLIKTASGAYVIGVVDALNEVPETDEANNVIDFGPLP